MGGELGAGEVHSEKKSVLKKKKKIHILIAQRDTEVWRGPEQQIVCIQPAIVKYLYPLNRQDGGHISYKYFSPFISLILVQISKIHKSTSDSAV